MKWAAILTSILWSAIAQAGDDTRTLPKGIFGVRVNNVFVTGADYEYGPGGQRVTTGEANASSISQQAAQTFNNPTGGIGKTIYNAVASILQSPSAASFTVSAIGNELQSLDLGKMEVNVTPTSTVTSPTLMYGVTNRWSTIVNVPVIKLDNEVAWQYIPGASTNLLDNASHLASLAGISIPNSSQFVSIGQSTLTQKGYKPLASEETQFVGDIYVMNLFDLGRLGPFSFGTMNTISLPTGPAHDANDLLDVGAFHHTFMEQEFTTVLHVTRKFQSYLSGSVRYYLPEQTSWRVPANAQDADPDITQEGTITRQVGFGTMAEGGVKYRVLKRFNTKAGVVYETKQADRFSGTIPGDYDVISSTFPYAASTATSYNLGVTYDPLTNYRPGSIPLMVDLSYQEVVAGVNTPAIKEVMISFSTYF